MNKVYLFNKFPFRTEDAVVAGVNILPAPADSGNVGFCLYYLEKKNTFNHADAKR
jgi:hypothetical protein